MCYQHPWQNEHIVGKGKERANSIPESESILVAVPATNDKMIDVYRLPGEQLKVKVPPVQVRSEEPGMVMAVKLVRHQASQNILLLAGYDGGVTAAFKLPGNCTGLATETAQLIYLSQPHSQPVLSLDALPDGSCYFTSSADAVIAMHKIPDLPYANNSKSSLLDKEGAPKATQEVEMMDKATEPSQRSRMSLSYIVEESPSASFAKQSVNLPSPATSKPSGVSSLLSSSVPLPRSKPVLQPMTTVQSPYKIVDSKHAGQQSLRVRSDGRLLVTGGWDARIRIYSTTTLKEVAVLKRHKEGVYAVAFNDILTVDDVRRKEDAKFVFVRAFSEGGSEGMVRLGITPAEGWVEMAEGFATALAGGESKYKNDLVAFLMLPGMFDRLVQAGHGDGVKIRAQRQRDEQTKLKHYVAAGAKDGKISLWEVF
jgi:WD40 repeat protein